MVLKCVYYFTVYILEWGEKKNYFKLFTHSYGNLKYNFCIRSVTEDFKTFS